VFLFFFNTKDITGALSLKDAVQVIYHRSVLQAQAARFQKGKMLAVGLSVVEAEGITAFLFSRHLLPLFFSPLSSHATLLFSSSLYSFYYFAYILAVLLKSYSLESQICIAAINSLHSVTLSGDSAAILKVHQMLLARNRYSQPLRVEAAYHSYHMDCIFFSFLFFFFIYLYFL
jgi:acyl transferase domain-containing protein